MTYTVTAPLVVAHTSEGDRYVYDGGTLPNDIDSDQLKQLIASKMVVKGEAPAAEPEETETTSEETEDEGAADGTIPEVLAEVGEDPEKAAAALEAEKAGKNRPTLVSKLEAIVEAEQS